MSLKFPPGLIPAIDMPRGMGLDWVRAYINNLAELEGEMAGIKYGSDLIEQFGYVNAVPIFDGMGYETPLICDMQKSADVPQAHSRQGEGLFHLRVFVDDIPENAAQLLDVLQNAGQPVLP